MRPSNKLDFIKLGSFEILKILRPVMYELNLLSIIRIIKIHYILVLELVDLEAPLIKNISDINLKSQEKV